MRQPLLPAADLVMAYISNYVTLLMIHYTIRKGNRHAQKIDGRNQKSGAVGAAQGENNSLKQDRRR